MKKHGFTLAEVLITLGIVGVIAALTAPGLVMNSRNEANAAKLAVSVSNLENALTSAIAQEGVDSLYRTSMWQPVDLTGKSDESDIARFIGGLGKYLLTNGFVRYAEGTGDSAKVDVNKYYNGVGPYEMNTNGSVKNDAKATGAIERLNKCFAIELKNGAILFMQTYANGKSPANEKTQDDIANLGGSLWSNAANLFIDVNGKSGPNCFGRDIFQFYVGNNGILYPYGSMDVSVFAYSNRTNVWSNSSAKDNISCVNGQIGSGAGCTARLISEGYKMNY